MLRCVGLWCRQGEVVLCGATHLSVQYSAEILVAAKLCPAMCSGSAYCVLTCLLLGTPSLGDLLGVREAPQTQTHPHVTSTRAASPVCVAPPLPLTAAAAFVCVCVCAGGQWRSAPP